MTPPIVIVGAGPVGLSVALGLARSGVKSTVIKRKAELDPHSRATVILPRTLEIFAQWGVLPAFLTHGNRVPHVRLRLAPDGEQIFHFDFTELTYVTATPFAVAISQDQTERFLLDEVLATGLVDVSFGTEVLGFEEHASGVSLNVRGPHGERQIEARYLVGADGAHSVVRQGLGLALEGKTYPTRALLADVRAPPEKDQSEFWPALLNERGLVVGIRFGGGVFRIVDDAMAEGVDEHNLDSYIARLTRRLFGAPASETVWKSIYNKHERSVSRFRIGRVLLVGDAAHLNSPAGGQGMNSGIQDAHNLAWKLAAAVTRDDADVDVLLQSYAQERWSYVDRKIQPFTDRNERFESAPAFLRLPLVRLAGKLPGFDRLGSAMARRLSMLDVKYNESALLRVDHRHVGRRLPDVIRPDGTRLLEGLQGGAVVCSGPDVRARRLAESLKVPLLDGDLAQLARFFRRERFVAVIRPDQIVGWIDNPDSIDTRTCQAAMGLRSELADGRGASARPI